MGYLGEVIRDLRSRGVSVVLTYEDVRMPTPKEKEWADKNSKHL